jgi:hypothetical protein
LATFFVKKKSGFISGHSLYPSDAMEHNVTEGGYAMAWLNADRGDQALRNSPVDCFSLGACHKWNFISEANL